jgi:hypothetical protein
VLARLSRLAIVRPPAIIAELPPRDGIINRGWKLEWERYSQWLTTDFLSWQAGIVNQYKRGPLRVSPARFEIVA